MRVGRPGDFCSSDARDMNTLRIVFLVLAAPCCLAQTTQPGNARVAEMLSALKPLPKPHYSWEMAPAVIEARGEHVYQYVRITRSVPVSLRWATRSQVDAAVGMALRATAAEPKERPVTLTLQSAPWHPDLEGKVPTTNPKDRCGDPSYDGPEVARHLRWTEQRISLLKRWIGGRVPVETILYDCECWRANGDPRHDAAMDLRHEQYLRLLREAFSGARTIMWDRGAVHPARNDAGWEDADYFTLREPGDHFSCYLEYLPDLTLTREVFKRTCRKADAFRVRDVIPWIALGCEAPYTFEGINRAQLAPGGYPVIYSWLLGAEINQTWYARRPERFAPWDRAPCVVFYPPAFDPRVPQWGRHFVAYVRGAQAVKELP